MIVRLVCFLVTLCLPALCAAQDGSVDVLGAFDEVFSDPSDFASDTDSDFELDEILAINMRAQALALARSLGFTLLDSTPLPALGFTVNRLRLPIGFNAGPLLATLIKADPLGLYGKNPVYRLAGEAASAVAPACVGLRCFGQSLIGWPLAGCAIPARIGMLDSALDMQNPVLIGAAITTLRISKKAVSKRENEHGTAVAAQLVGRLAAGSAGLLPQAKIFAADVFELDDRARPFTDALKLTQGLNWLATQQLSTLNISITGPDSPVLQKAVQVLVGKGVAIAAAAGNLGSKAAAQYPAAYADVLAVTAVDRKLRIYGKANQGSYVGIAAPGVGVWSAGQFRDGTSHAAPFATAALALVNHQRPALTSPQRLAVLAAGSRDLGAAGRDPVFGFGLLQMTGACAP